jgi:hypothetical protein
VEWETRSRHSSRVSKHTCDICVFHEWSIKAGIFDIAVKLEILEIGFGQRLLPPTEEVSGIRKLSKKKHQVEGFPQVNPNHSCDMNCVQIWLSAHYTKSIKSVEDVYQCRHDKMSWGPVLGGQRSVPLSMRP